MSNECKQYDLHTTVTSLISTRFHQVFQMLLWKIYDVESESMTLILI